MTQHWHPIQELDPVGPGEWVMHDRGHRIGYIQAGRINKKRAYRGVLEGGQVVGYERTLYDCARSFWDWYIRYDDRRKPRPFSEERDGAV